MSTNRRSPRKRLFLVVNNESQLGGNTHEHQEKSAVKSEVPSDDDGELNLPSTSVDKTTVKCLLLNDRKPAISCR